MMPMNPSKKIAFHTFGCKVNQYETEELRHQLSLGGYEVVPFEAAADVFVINSCSVTADADSSCRQLVRKILREHSDSRIVVTGCYAERAPDELRELSSKIEVFGNKEKPLIAMALGVPTACVEAAAKKGVSGLADRSRAYIKVQDGCDAHCTYCIIPSVRPDLVCRPPALILQEAAQIMARGFREIVLTGVRLGRYEWAEVGGDKKHWELATLLEALLALEGDFRIRLSSIEVTEIPDAVIAMAATHPKLCPFFHIPLQSGDNEVLKRMGRWYKSEEYRERIHQIRARVPEVAFSADVIVGFPGETEEAFGNTVRLLEEENFSRVHAFRFSSRPGTPAEKLSAHVDPRIKSVRTRAMVQVDKKLRAQYASRFIGKSLRVLQESTGAGYSERYIRVQSSAPTHEGTFQTVQGTQLTPEGVLLATPTI
jgi:threonylcarbamoyladenosine tRNA methylthiotransferase MtaB